ncbi:MAG: zinc-binding dehydrogenase [Candidatus Kariarchaeaceae archaeon]|jgi:NADPH:quinone reductase-like Zn-dependent oxidoreductase
MFWTKLNKKKIRTVMLTGTEADSDYLRDLFEEGKVKIVIDQQFPMSQIADAHRYYEKGYSRGKVIIKVIEP